MNVNPKRDVSGFLVAITRSHRASGTSLASRTSGISGASVSIKRQNNIHADILDLKSGERLQWGVINNQGERLSYVEAKVNGKVH
jgi:hypothetical protein